MKKTVVVIATSLAIAISIPAFFIVGFFGGPVAFIKGIIIDTKISSAVRYAKKHSGDLSRCDQLESLDSHGIYRSDMKSRCYRFYAQESGDEKVCDLIQDSQESDSCYEITAKTSSTCFKIKEESLKGFCLGKLSTLDQISCETLPETLNQAKRSCYARVAMELGESGCVRIQSKSRDLCFLELARHQNNERVCNKIQEPYLRGECIGYVAQILSFESCKAFDPLQRKGCYSFMMSRDYSLNCNPLTELDKSECIEGSVLHCENNIERDPEGFHTKSCYSILTEKYGKSICNLIQKKELQALCEQSLESNALPAHTSPPLMNSNQD